MTDDRGIPSGSGRTDRSAPEPVPAGPKVHMDPRIRDRRIAVRRDEGRRRRRVLLAAVGAVCVGLSAWGASRSPLLDVDYVDVRGTDHTPRLAVLAAARLTGHRALASVDTGQVAERVRALPWVATVTARRVWPGTVRIDLRERAAVAVLPVAGGEQWALSDATGRVLAVGPDKPAALPVIGGLPDPGEPGTTLAGAARDALRVAASLPPGLRPRVADVASLPDGGVELQLHPPGTVVRLGRPEQLDAKFAALGTLLDKAPVAGAAVLDVRVPTSPVLTRRPGAG